ncbi:MAG TPA: hypothetical protein VEL02_06585, partial [Jatrophihabitantaceae bacterium]|nr:hypothetical protein [Jatrophihabitantaceae bacterium]
MIGAGGPDGVVSWDLPEPRARAKATITVTGSAIAVAMRALRRLGASIVGLLQMDHWAGECARYADDALHPCD